MIIIMVKNNDNIVSSLFFGVVSHNSVFPLFCYNIQFVQLRNNAEIVVICFELTSRSPECIMGWRSFPILTSTKYSE